MFIRLRNRPKRFWVLLSACVASLSVMVVLLPVEVCVDRAFIDQCTGSRRGGREWVFGVTNNQWYWESPLEIFIRQRFPSELEQRWVCYAGNGRDIYGLRTSMGHGRPGPVINIDRNLFLIWFRDNTDSEKKALYDTLRRADRDAMRKAVDDLEQSSGAP